MSFSIEAVASAFELNKQPERWLSIGTSEHHQIRDCVKNKDGSYDLWFYSRPTMTLKQHQATSSTYSLSYITPVAQNQVSRKAVHASLEKGVLIFTADGVFKVHSVRKDKIFITQKGQKDRIEKNAIYVEVNTRLGKRLFLYEENSDGFLQPLIAHHAIMGIYLPPNYSYIPEQFDASHASWIPPLALSVYDYEAKYVVALGKEYAQTAEALGKICKVDTKVVSHLRAVRTEATFQARALGLPNKVYALSRYLEDSIVTKNTNAVTTTTITKAPTVPKVATVDSTKLKGIVVSLHKLLADAREEAHKLVDPSTMQTSSSQQELKT